MKKAILIVSFGTTYPDTRQKNIAAITRQVRALYPDAVVEEAVSSTIVRNAMKKREHIEEESDGSSRKHEKTGSDACSCISYPCD